MIWPLPSPQDLGPVTLGIRAQWRLQAPAGQLPVFVEILSWNPRWLLGVLHGRALASRTPDAKSFFSVFQHEAQRLLGCDFSSWPTISDYGVGVLPLNSRSVELPSIAPGQSLLLSQALASTDLTVRSCATVLLACAFGDRDSATRAEGLPGEQRLRLCGLALPEGLRARWDAELGLEPLEAVAPAGVLAATQLMLAAYTPTALAAPPTMPPANQQNSVNGLCDAVGADAVLDLLLSAATIRACLARDEPMLRAA